MKEADSCKHTVYLSECAIRPIIEGVVAQYNIMNRYPTTTSAGVHGQMDEREKCTTQYIHIITVREREKEKGREKERVRERDRGVSERERKRDYTWWKRGRG